MRRSMTIAAAACVIFCTEAASAADLPTKAPPYRSPQPFAYDWTGFYLGAHVSYSWSSSDTTTVNTVTSAIVDTGSESTSAFHGGGQIGYDYMSPSRWLFGVVADVSSGASHTVTATNHTTEGSTDVGGTVRGRLGYAFDRVLVYATGGWAWETGSSTRTQTVGTTGNATPGTVEKVDLDRNGWTVGAGIAHAFAPNWNVFGEYRYTDWGSITNTFAIAQRATTVSTTANLVEIGVNYKF